MTAELIPSEHRTGHRLYPTVLPHWLVLVALICCGATFVTACSGESSSSPPPPADPAPPPQAPAPPPAPPADPAPPPQAPAPPPAPPAPPQGVRCPAGWPIELGYENENAGMYMEVPYCASDPAGVDTVVVNRSPLVWSFDPSTDLPRAGTLATPTATFFRSYVEPQSFPQQQYMLPGEIYRVPTHTVSWWPDYTLTAEWVGLSEAFKQIFDFGPQAYADAISRKGLPGRAAYACGKSAASAIGSVAQITDETVYLDKIKAGVQTSTAGAKCANLLVELEKAEAQKTGKVPAAVSAWEIRTRKWTSTNQFMDDLLKGLKYVISSAK